MKRSKKSLAIIGSKGMVGSDLFGYLEPYFQNIAGIYRENYNKYRGQSFDVVINANGNSSKVWANENVFEDFMASTTSTYQILFDFPAKTCIHISSSDVYENHARDKTTSEETIINPENLSPYGFHKFLSECIIRNSRKNYIILRCPMILGTNLKKGPIYDILHNSRIFVSLDSRFQMITTRELAQVINFLIARDIKKEIFNVGGRGKFSLKEIGSYLNRQVIFPKDGETHIYETDVSKLHKIYRLKTSGEYLQDFLKDYRL